MADKSQRSSNPKTPPSKDDDPSPTPSNAAVASHVSDAPDNHNKAQVKTQHDGPTRVIEKPKGARVFGTPENIHEPHVPSVKTMLDESSLGE